MKTILKVLSALAAIAGAVYVIATYGDKIVAWAKKIMASCPCCSEACKCACESESDTEAPAEEAPAEEVPAEEAPAEEAPVEEVVIADNEPVAVDEDFAE
ncbi:MAG: hypothetical protein PUD38_00415 [Firmicutes bacterium]|nr:hypothetical protein [Bacillota bacterium]